MPSASKRSATQPAELPPWSADGGLLALDLGTHTGWALRDCNGMACSGTQSFQPSRYEGAGMRFLRFQRWLDQLAGWPGPDKRPAFDVVVFEEVRRHRGVDAAHIYGGFLAHLGAFCEHHHIPHHGVPVGTWKRHVVGSGNASKGQVIDAVRALGHSPADDNEADAIAILQWATATARGPSH